MSLFISFFFFYLFIFCGHLEDKKIKLQESTSRDAWILNLILAKAVAVQKRKKQDKLDLKGPIVPTELENNATKQ